MATYSFNVKPQGKTKYGARIDAKTHCEYINREGNYSNRDDLVVTGYGNLPSWTDGKPEEFWKAADAYERINGNSYREITWALPCEFDGAENDEIVEEFCRNQFGNDYVFSYAIHEKPSSIEGINNIHVHIMFSERQYDNERYELSRQDFFRRYSEDADGNLTGGYKKNRIWQKKEKLYQMREEAARIINKHYQEHGMEERVDHRSFKVQKQELELQGRFSEAECFDIKPQKRVPAKQYYSKDKEKNISQIKQDFEDDCLEFSVHEQGFNMVNNVLSEEIKNYKKDLYQAYQHKDVIYVVNLKDYFGNKRFEAEQAAKKNHEEIQALGKEKIHPNAIGRYVKSVLSNGEYGKLVKQEKSWKENIAYRKDTYQSYEAQEKKLVAIQKQLEQLEKQLPQNKIVEMTKQIEEKNSEINNKIKQLYGSNKRYEGQIMKYNAILDSLENKNNNEVIYIVNSRGFVVEANKNKENIEEKTPIFQPSRTPNHSRLLTPSYATSMHKLKTIERLANSIEKRFVSSDRGFTATKELSTEEIQDMIRNGQLQL